MAEKNRFSRLLKTLISASELKNYTLAQELGYDVSYISKWISGQIIPSEKYAEKILTGISECVVNKCEPEALAKLMQNYQVDSRSQLKQAVYDNLEAEYHYVREMQSNSEDEGTVRTSYYPELKLPQYIDKMWHPVLRRVNALDVVGALDMFAMGREYQMQIAEGKGNHVPEGKMYQDVHYYMLVDVRPEKMNSAGDVIFLVDLLTRNSCIDFRLYSSEQAGGKAIFVVKDEYLISGMLAGDDRCLSVTISENPENCKAVYRNLKDMCNRDRLLFRRTTLQEMLRKHEYVHTLFALRQQWLMGHLTEHFLPEDLFEEILQTFEADPETVPAREELRDIHRISRKVVEEFHISLLIYRTAFYNLAVDRTIDFFNHKVRLTPEQTIRCLGHFAKLCRSCPGLEVKMIPGRLISDIEYNTRECIFLSDTVSYLRLGIEHSNVFIIDRKDMREAFGRMFCQFFEDREGTLITDRELIAANIEHVVSGISREERPVIH